MFLVCLGAYNCLSATLLIKNYINSQKYVSLTPTTEKQQKITPKIPKNQPLIPKTFIKNKFIYTLSDTKQFPTFSCAGYAS